MSNTRVSMIVAIGRNRAIGKENKLLWSIPEDLKRFRNLTRGHPVVMGRKTFDSILSYVGKPLPDRPNVVITRDSNWRHEGVVTAASVEDGIEKAKALDPLEVFVIGGAQIYEQALPYTDRLYLTLIDDEQGADTFFPPYEHIFVKRISQEDKEYEGLAYSWVDLEK